MSAVVEVRAVQKTFKKHHTQDLLVLDEVNLTLRKGEIVALLGTSGSGKSTLLRIIAGLIAPSSGEVYFDDKIVTGPVPGIGMVFQNFALLPWLTVLQNVELGLEAQGVSPEQQRKQAKIDMLHVA